MFLSNNQAGDATEMDSVFTTASTLGTLLWAAIARASSKKTAGPILYKSRSNGLEESRSRIPIPKSDLRLKQNTKAKETNSYDLKRKDIPQSLVSDSFPAVHDRLPNPQLWEEIDRKLEQQEKDILLSSALKTKSDITTSTSLKQENQEANSYFKKASNPNQPQRKRRSTSTHPDLEGVLRRRQLYCRTGYHMQILPNGRVTGTIRDHDKYAIIEFISIEIGLVTIRGVDSGRYLSMDSRGRLYGSVTITSESIFRETLQENWYNTYSSNKHRSSSNGQNCFVALNKHGKMRQGCRSGPNQRFTHFLPRAVDPEKVPDLYRGILY